MKKKVTFWAAALLCSACFSVQAQESEFETTIGADFVSQYVWRGQELGGASLQPSLGISYGGLSLEAWGSVGLSSPSDTREFDLTLGYEIGGFNIAVTDYWFNEGPDAECRYFHYGKDSTNHLFEANLGYDFGFMSIQWYTNFLGADAINMVSGKPRYSSYLELSAPFSLGGLDWTATVGAVPFGTEFYDVEGFGITNIELKAEKEIGITDSFSLPVFAAIAANPCANAVHLVFGLSF